MQPNTVNIIEVGPRDGLQNEPTPLDVATRVNLINQLSNTGLTTIEVGSFVSPKWVPQMAETDQVFRQITKTPQVDYPVLVPNEQGMQMAIELGVKTIAIFTAASESFNQKNINCSISESFTRFAPVIALAKQHQIKVRGYLSCVLGCPYEGETNPTITAELTQQLLELGCYQVSLGDTIGRGTPKSTETLLKQVLKHAAAPKLAVHFHDTGSHALANIDVALQHAINNIDSSIGGLGGCPYAPGASGNVATEDVVNHCQQRGIETGVDLAKLVTISREICAILGIEPRAKVTQAWKD